MRILKNITGADNKTEEIIYDKEKDELKNGAFFEYEIVLSAEEMHNHAEKIIELIPEIIANGIEVYSAQSRYERLTLCGKDGIVVGSPENILVFRTLFESKKTEEYIKKISKIIESA